MATGNNKKHLPFIAKQLTVMRAAIVLAILVFAFSLCPAQEKNDKATNRYERIFGHNHISFTAATNWTQKAKTKSTGGPYSVGSQTMRGWEAGFNYHLNFRNKSYSLILGLHGLAIPRNYDIFIPKEDFTPAIQEDYAMNKRLTRTIDMHFSLPVLLEKRLRGTKNNFWNIDAGIAIGFYPDEIYEGWGSFTFNGQPQTPVYTMDLLVSSNFKPWVNYVVSAGHTWILKNSNMLKVNLQANYTGFTLAKGDYEINVQGNPISTGTYASRLSGAGIAFSYILSSSRKQLMREYKKLLKERGF